VWLIVDIDLVVLGDDLLRIEGDQDHSQSPQQIVSILNRQACSPSIFHGFPHSDDQGIAFWFISEFVSEQWPR
jgi:hypothetical protein